MISIILPGCKKELSEKEPVLKAMEHPSFIPDGIRKFILTEKGEEVFCLSKEPADYKMEFDYWEIINPYEDVMTVNTEEMYRLFETLSELDFTTGEAAEGLETGIENSDMGLLLEFVNTEDTGIAKNTEKADSKVEVLFGNTDGEGNIFAALKGKEEQVYRIPQEIVQEFYKIDAFDYILKIPALVDIQTVSEVEIKMENQTWKLQPDVEKGLYKCNKEKVEKDDFTKLYQALSSVILREEATGALPSGDEEVLKVVYHRNMEDAPEIEIQYFTWNEQYDYVEINQNCRFLVEKTSVDSLVSQIKSTF